MFHPSILLIQQHIESNNISFIQNNRDKWYWKEINSIYPEKVVTNNSLLKYWKNKVFAIVLHKLIDISIKINDFPQNLKLADITSVHKKNDPIDEKSFLKKLLISYQKLSKE